MPRILVILALCGVAAHAAAAPARRGDVAPPFVAKDTAGKSIKLSDFKGKKNVLLVFWSAEGCSVADDLKAIEKLHAAHKGKPLVVLGVNADGMKANAVAKWLKTQKITYTNVVDEKVAIADKYGVVITPVFVLIDQQGVIQARYAGGGGPVLDALATDTEELLREGKVTAREEPAPTLPSG